jgi:uncharacterized protein YecE (DUF72 family)
MGELRIGCSGWSYKHWRGSFYPQRLPHKQELAYYASRFDTAEINGSFYRLPSEAAVQGWAERAPPGFLFAWKASRYITHNKKLNDCADSIALVFGRMAPLGDHFGPVLFQLPPNLHFNPERLAAFLELLPADRRCTFEFRHPSWYVAETFEILKSAGASLCISDHHDAPSPWEVTAPFVYVRGHGPGGRYFGRYDPEELKRWAAHIRAWRGEGRDVYVYFDNDIGTAAPVDAEALIALLA